MAVFLGPFRVEHPFILAPMAGITNSPFRRLMRELGSSLVVSELVSANGLEYGNKRTQELLKFVCSERPVGLQIFGEQQEALENACKYLENLGADFIDLNLGCPVKKIVQKGAGCAMTREPKILSEVLHAMVKSVKIPVTIKIRTGWNESEKNALEVVKIATDAGVAWAAIHGRTRSQAYEGFADWDFIGNIKAKSSIPIIGNGDVTTPEIAVQRYKDYGVDGVMIGRGALRNPFIFQQSGELLNTGTYSQPSLEDYMSLFRKQKAYLFEQLPERNALLQSKKFMTWYVAGFPGCHAFRKKVFEIHDYEDLWKEAFEFLEPRVANRDWQFLQDRFLMGGHG